MAQLTIASLLFLALHLLPSTPLRPWARARLGENSYRMLFSLLSLAALVWMIMSYNDAGAQVPLWVTGAVWRWTTVVLMLLAFLLVVAGATAPNPSSMTTPGALDRAEPWGGIFAITRHPVMWGIGLWGLLHLSNRPDAASAWLFGTITVLAIFGSNLQEIRKRKEGGEAWRAFEAKTSFVPFVAVFSGRAKLSFRQIGWWRIVLAIVAWAALLHFHRAIFGVLPIPIG